MRRRLFPILCALSLLLCAAVCVLWVRSYWHRDYICGGYTGGRWVCAVSSEGAVQWLTETQVAGDRSPARRLIWDAGSATPDETQIHEMRGAAPWTSWHEPANGARVLGWGYGNGSWSPRGLYRLNARPSYRRRYIQTPIWPLAAVTLLAPVASVRKWCRAGRRVRLGLCPACGYDLRATPGRCPECGTAVQSPPPA